ncbi:MAG: T9SS type A sorting domain-containing protein [Bacteroidales bacterium]|nr:T9SS type A sorting domain-containing protein [Bacteroidales bacterium]
MAKRPLRVYPNPNTSGKINIEAPPAIGKFVLTLMDINGSTVFHKTIEEDDRLTEIQLKDALKGTYIVQMLNSNFNLQSKLILL